MACFTAIVAVLMLLLWLFQVVLLDRFYQSVKTYSIRRAAQKIAQNIDEIGIDRQLDNLTRKPDIYLRILDREGRDIYQSRSGPMSLIHDMDADAVELVFRSAEESGGTVLNLFRQDSPKPFEDSPFGSDWQRRYFRRGTFTTLVIYAQLVETRDRGTLMILLSTALTPLSTTTETLKAQFVVIAVILMLLSAGAALFLSRIIGDPLVSLSRSAGALATGKYDVDFSGGSGSPPWWSMSSWPRQRTGAP